MVRYSEKFKLQVLKKMMPPSRLSMAEIGRQTGPIIPLRNCCSIDDTGNLLVSLFATGWNNAVGEGVGSKDFDVVGQNVVAAF